MDDESHPTRPAPGRADGSRARLSLVAIAGLVLALTAAAAIASLWLLLRLHDRAIRQSASLSAVQYGLLVTRQLAQQPLALDAAPSAEDAAAFDRLVDALQALEPGLEYVSVSERDAVIYSRQPGLEPAPSRGADLSVAVTSPAAPIRIGRKHLRIGSQQVPVLTFTRAVRGPGAQERDVQTAFRRDVFERALGEAAPAVTALFRFAVAILLASFGLSALAVGGLIRRERTWQQRQRLNEHLAFAGAMAGSIIHDFRNPMSAMRLDAQLLIQEARRGAESRGARLAELAGRIARTLERVDHLLVEFLAIARPEAAARAPFDLNACVLDSLELVRPRFAAADIALAENWRRARFRSRGYPIQFKRAVLNVLHNAEQFSPPRSTVTVHTARTADDAELCITDEGSGIDPADRARIFDMFFSRRPGGTGMGLALAKTAVENGGGSIAAETPPSGKGSRFVIRIPLDPRSLPSP